MGWQEWRNFLGPNPVAGSTTSYFGPDEDVMGGMQSLVTNYNKAYGAAKAANEARYRQLLAIADQTTNQRATDIRSDYTGQQSNIMQRLARLGMSNTTVAPTMQLGVQKEQQSALNRLADTMQQTKLGIIERRKDAYPDQGALMNLIAGIGSSYGGGSGNAAMMNAFQRMTF
jgi:hypothetical protein